MLKLSRIKKRLQKGSYGKLTPLKTTYGKTVRFVDRKPLTSFFVVLALLLAVIVVGSFARKPKVEEVAAKPAPKAVRVYSIGDAPRITVQAKVQKSGIVKITAATPGVISNINIVAGQKVSKGTNLLSLASNYSGSNPASVQRELAAAQYQNVKDTFQTQKDLIGKQREVADKNRENTVKLRDITDKSLGETRDLISLNDSILANLQAQLQTQTPGSSAYIQTQSQISQFQSANNQIRQGLRNAEYQTNNDNPPNKLSELQTDITRKQLDLQDKAIDLSKKTSALQLKLAQVAEASMFPVSPFQGVVERVHAQVGESVNPGTVLVTITGTDQSTVVEAFVPLEIANSISAFTPATLHLRDQTLDLLPTYVSSEATEGQLYSVVFAIPQGQQLVLTDESFITIDLAIGVEQSETDPFVPIDSIHQTQDKNIVYVVQDQKAKAREIKLGTIQGSFMQVLGGLGKNDKVIVTRNVIAGDVIKVEN